MVDVLTRLGKETEVSTTGGRSLVQSYTAALAGGGYVTAWSDGLPSGDLAFAFNINNDLQIRFTGPNGIINGQTTTTIPSVGYADPAIAALPSGGAVVVYSQEVGTTERSDTDLVGQLFDSVGRPVGARFAVSSTNGGSQSAAAVATLPDGGFIASWATSGTTAWSERRYFLPPAPKSAAR